jgi:ABC-type Fe3+ transport system permease subunit
VGKVRLDGETLWCTTVLIGVAFLVLYPILLIVSSSFQVARPGSAPLYGLQGWRTALSNPGMRQALYNTFGLILTRQLISFPVAILLARLLSLLGQLCRRRKILC